ncbi:MAG: CBS domain-containing protein [Gammaproteobacteria bacterium]|nr:CBS domain-containing protein [Gammaproteobacteria bacterium]
MNPYTQSTTGANTSSRLLQPITGLTQLSSQAINQFVAGEFVLERPVLINAETSIEQAEIILRQTHHHTGLIVDRTEKVLGVVTTYLLKSRRVLQYASRTGLHRSDIRIINIMAAIGDHMTLPVSLLETLKPDTLLSRLKQANIECLLLLDESKNITGILDVHRLIQSLGVADNAHYRPRSLANIVENLLHDQQL